MMVKNTSPELKYCNLNCRALLFSSLKITKCGFFKLIYFRQFLLFQTEVKNTHYAETQQMQPSSSCVRPWLTNFGTFPTLDYTSSLLWLVK